MAPDYLKPTNRLQEIYGGFAVLAASALLGFFGVRGTIMYLHGSREAPADPVACAIGITAGLGGGYVGLRLLFGWHQDGALLPNAFLLLGGVVGVAGGVWFYLIDRSLHTSIASSLNMAYYFEVLGATALLLWWRRRRGRT